MTTETATNMEECRRIRSYVKVKTTETYKGIGAKGAYQYGYETSEPFRTLEDAVKHIKDRYEGKKRQPLYRDPGIQTGYIFGFRNEDEGGKFTQQDWVEITIVNEYALKSYAKVMRSKSK